MRTDDVMVYWVRCTSGLISRCLYSFCYKDDLKRAAKLEYQEHLRKQVLLITTMIV